ncbi:O-antigen ligase family protein [Nodosilinea sp. LEGE 07088]|uniref:O-antigen ligase family protein n=1 Tax=Nodosilinea sp. LEGE 07088 TaxID=2777968 RepID=UPI00188273C3|nr:O-antigen ligase family protein [Nodosilinea sp. LEGE 07088]MBE9137131.1 O-antigen ligase family protein [Nodosilinea sp. LEGE 07088]
MTEDALPKPEPVASTASDGTLLALLTAAFYTLFTLLPGSSTLMVSWPWVFLWQVGLTLPPLWLGWQLWHRPGQRLGHGFDWVAVLAVLGLVAATVGAEFPAQARWYGWAAMGAIALVYALSGWLRDVGRARTLLRFQGYLTLAFILLSLVLWFTQIYLPELARLQTLQGYGVNQAFNFGLTSLRNWQPIGHQNYVAGYLVLVLPLLAALAWADKGWQRGLWGIGVVLGLLNLYTTSSRGGWLALMITGLLAVGVGLVYARLPRRTTLVIAGIALGLLVVGAVVNRRLWQLLGSLATGNFAGGELSYRVVTNVTGWRMGRSHPFTGIGPGGVPLAYQQYRPTWAGRDAELQFQLHSTPAQLWGELGIWGILVPLALVLVLGWLVLRWLRSGAQTTPSDLPPVLVWGLLAGLFAFGLIGLTDYQLDIPAIAATLALYLAVLARTFTPASDLAERPASPRRHRLWAGLCLGLILAMTLWLVPAHRAWGTASGGFWALTDEPPDINRFATELGQAHALAPWEPYYPYQLGYNLGDFALQVGDDPPLRQALLTDAIAWFETGNQIVPYQEFGQSNLGWLQIENGQPDQARAAFIQATALVPAKMGVFFGLGVACLQTNNLDCATEALALEVIRHPTLLTSPLLQTGSLAGVYAAVLDRLEQRYGELIEQAEDSSLASFLHRARGSLRWWRGDWAAAAQDWQTDGTEMHQAMLDLATGSTVEVESWPETPTKYAILAWQTPDQRQALLAKAWVTQPADIDDLTQALPPPQVIANLEASMTAAKDFVDWLQRTAPTWQPRSQRLGFGVLSRHIDGPNPSDFLPRVENIPIVKFFEPLYPSPIFFPALDQALAPYQARLQG